MASADNSKTIIMPTDIAKVIGSLRVLVDTLGVDKRSGDKAE